jgi:TonB family protein
LQHLCSSNQSFIQNQKHMKNYLLLFVIAASLAVSQGCSPKADESSAQNASDAAANATLVKNSDAEKLAAKRTARTKARLEKEEQRRLAVLAKAKLSPTYSDLKGNVVYYKAEVDPAYTGGMEGLETYLKANLTYPAGAREKGLEGTVFVDFVIDTKGRVREVVASDVVGEDVDASFKEESVRVVAGMPAWNPGRQHGIAVDAAFSIPITFQLEN